MANKQSIYWLPSPSPNVVAYEILASDTGIDGEYKRHALVLSDMPGPNWDPLESRFFFHDDEVPYRYYRLRVFDRYGNIAADDAPMPFQANNNPARAPKLHFIALSSDFDEPGKFRYVTPGGSSIRNADVRIYRKIDYVTQQFEKIVGSTTTNDYGSWPPIFVEPGETYTIVLHKPYEYGPTTAEITL